MDLARSQASEHWVLAWSALFTGASAVLWYVYVSHDVPASTAGLSALLAFLASCLIVLWLVRIKASDFKLDVMCTWCLLLVGWCAYQLMVPGRDFEPALLVVCLTAAILVSVGISVVLAVWAKLRKE